MPPGSAKPSRRAAMLTPSPKISSPSAMMSPRLIPTRNSIRSSGGIAELRSTIPPLHFDGAAHGINHPRELDQHPVAGGLDHPAVMFGDLGIDQFAAMRLQTFVRPLLVHPHQTRVASTSAARIAVRRRTEAMRRLAYTGRVNPSPRGYSTTRQRRHGRERQPEIGPKDRRPSKNP